MRRTTAISPRGVSAAFLGTLWLCATPARAADDEQVWAGVSTAMPVAHDVSLQGEMSYRFREGDDLFLTRGTLDWKMADGVTLGGGMAFAQVASTSEYRPFQQITLSTGPLSFRTRLEERIFDGADRAQLRLRQKMQLTLPVAKATKAALSGEWLYIARSQVPGRDARTDQWRLNGTLTQLVSPQVDVTGGYLYIRTPLAGGADRNSHVGQLTLTFRP